MSSPPLHIAAASSDPPCSPVARLVADTRARCAQCSLRELCMPIGLDSAALDALDKAMGPRRRLRRGEALYRAGDDFEVLYAVRFGSLKTTLLAPEGREQVTGYHILGDIVGLDGIANRSHGCTVVALEDSEVCPFPFEEIEPLAREHPALQRNLMRFLSQEVNSEQRTMLMLGSMRAEERVASFLLDLGERYRSHGYSGTEFVLRMTREEIGSYLGLKLETVSRLLSRLQAEGLVQLNGQGREVKLLDVDALSQLAGRAS